MNTLGRSQQQSTGFATFLSHADARCRICGTGLDVPSSLRDDYAAGDGQYSARCATGKHGRTWYDVKAPAEGGAS